MTTSPALAPPTVSEVLLGLPLASVEEVTAVVGKMRDAGGDVLAEPTQQAWGFTGVATDPDGHAWQLTAV